MSYSQRLPLVAFVALFLSFEKRPCFGGDAAFSKDGQRIYVIASTDGNSALREIDLANQTNRLIALPQLSQDNFPVGIARSEWDKFPLITRKSIWAFDPKSGRLTKVLDASKNGNFFRIAYDPKSRQIFLTSNEGLFLLKSGRELVQVFVRRHDAVGSLVFTSDGEMFCGEGGDLWHGKVGVEEGRYSLTAYRYAPLGALETANTTPSETGVRDVAVTRDTIYVHLARLGGSGWGWLAQLTRPVIKADASEEFGGPIKPEDCLPMYENTLHSVKILGENNRSANLCVSPDETRVYYSNEDHDWLITNGRPEELHLRGR